MPLREERYSTQLGASPDVIDETATGLHTPDKRPSKEKAYNSGGNSGRKGSKSNNIEESWSSSSESARHTASQKQTVLMLCHYGMNTKGLHHSSILLHRQGQQSMTRFL